jgi:hypothetical protein
MTPTDNELKTKPWNNPGWPTNAAIHGPKGMIGPEERACYYWLGRNWLAGHGCIVDAGSFVGASTFCFAAGAADGGRRAFNGGKLVHAFDYFKVVDQYVGEALSRDFRIIAQGESYLDVFEAQTAFFSDMIATYPGDFLTHRWCGEPIEILFIDIAKTAALNAHACGEFLPHLIPGRSVVLQQDYYHCWHPYIHISMEYLTDELELVDDHVPYQSALWRLLKPIPKEKIARLAADDLTNEERLALLDRLIAKSSPTIKPMIEVVKLWQLCLDRDWDAARRHHADIRARYDLAGSGQLWVRQAAEIVKAHPQKLAS